MNNLMQSLNWGTEFLQSHGYSMEHSPETLNTTPWSMIIQYHTSAGHFYLKKTAPALSLEPHIIQLLKGKFNANVPIVIAINDELQCFLTKDAGKPLRKILKTEFNPDLLCQAIKQFSAIQRSTESDIEMFIKMGIPDWRLDKLPLLYEQMILQADFLKSEGITDNELKTLLNLSPKFLKKCKLLSEYGIPETLGFHDFHDNNILIDPNTKKMTFIDFAETAIIHPFFSLYTCLWQAIKHHGVKDEDQTYQKLRDACFENWLELATKDELLKAFSLIKQLWSIYSALDCYRVMMSVDLKAYRTFYANRPSLLAAYLREFIIHH